MMTELERNAIPSSTVIKRLGDDRVGGYLMVWGNENQRDLEGQWFTPNTYLGNVLGTPQDALGRTIKTTIPWLFDHTLEDLPDDVKQFDDVRDYTLGVIETAKPDEIGVWVEAQLNRHDEWSNAVMDMIDRGVLSWSSGSAPLYAKAAPTGEITAWPVVEGSSTPTPAEPRHTQNVLLKHFVNPQDAPDKATAAQAARADAPDIQPTETETEVDAMTLTLTENTARAVVLAYAESEFETIKSAVEGLDATKQGNMIEEALRPLATELAGMAGVDDAMALSWLVGFVAEHAMESPESTEPTEEEPVMSDQPTLSADVDKIVESAVAKALQAQLPTESNGQALTGDVATKVKSINLAFGQSKHDMESVKSLSDLIYAMTHGRHDLLRPYHAASTNAYKALGINPDTAGGYLVPVEQSNQMIELLRDTSKVLPLCREVPLNSDTLTIPKQTGGATAYWVGENSSITASQQTFGQITLVAKKLAALVQVSNELIMDSDPAVDGIIREDITRVLALETDRVILEGSGVANQPLGLLNLGVTTTPLNNPPTYNSLVDAVSRVEVENVMETPGWGWVFNPREKHTFRKIQDAQGAAAGVGAYIFTEMGSTNAMVGGIPSQLLGYGYETTTQITPDTADNNETEIYFGQWNDVVVGVRKTIELATSNEAGNAFQYDQTWIRAIMRMDVNIRHAESIEVLTDVRAS
ncbi:MAG: phage major capsid protein [Planctomycetota bacterium]|jgi:HK97 family phage major capsid protein